MPRIQAVRAAPIPARRKRDLRSALNGFDPRVRQRAEALALSHDYIADLVWSFPAALHVLASAAPSDSRADTAEQMVRAGAPLGAIARALAIPGWLRMLPAYAFRGPLPRLPDTADFAHQIGNFVPKQRTRVASWLGLIGCAYEVCDEPFALWVASRFSDFSSNVEAEGIEALALFAWFSNRPSLEAAALIERPWTPALGLGEALVAALKWSAALDFAFYGAPYVALSTETRFVDGFEFVPLETAAEVLCEARAMENCLEGYAGTLASGCDQVWGVRMHGQRVAVLHIALQHSAGGLPLLIEIRGPGNRTVSGEVLHATYKWLLAWPAFRRDMDEVINPVGCLARDTRRNYQRLMKPYWRDKQTFGRFPLDGSFVGVARGLWSLRRAQSRRQRF